MLKRIVTALIAIPLLLLVIFKGGEVGMAIFVAIVAAIGVGEYLTLAGHPSTGLSGWLLKIWGAVVALSFLCPSHGVPGALLAMGALVYLLCRTKKSDPSPELMADVGKVSGAWLIVAYFLGHAVWIREYGHTSLIFLILLVMVGDSSAYFVGTFLGKHKLAPRLSPKKTIEGALGSLVGSAVAGYYFAWLLPEGFSPIEVVAISLFINVTAQAGDLAESLLKRCANVKDSGNIFPGHGGMLDRVDSFLPTLPIFAAILMGNGG